MGRKFGSAVWKVGKEAFLPGKEMLEIWWIPFLKFIVNKEYSVLSIVVGIRKWSCVIKLDIWSRCSPLRGRNCSCGGRGNAGVGIVIKGRRSWLSKHQKGFNTADTFVSGRRIKATISWVRGLTKGTAAWEVGTFSGGQ